MQSPKCPFLLCLIVLILSWNSFGQVETYTLIVRVKGGVPNKGQAVISLFDSKESYLKNPKDIQHVPMDRYGEAETSINGLAGGRYAVSATYDEDNNGKLNTGFLGIPTELVGFSNDVRGTLGPPSFDQSSFQIRSSQSITIHFGNAKD